jgi:hypothetical protein
VPTFCVKTKVSESDYANVLCTWTFGSLSLSERHSLTFLEVVVVNSVEARHVEKQVFPISNVDESKTLVS